MTKQNTKGTAINIAPPPSSTAKGTKGSPETLQPSRNLNKEPSGDNVPLNFKVNSAFRRDLKIEAADRGMTMTSLLYEIFDFWKQHHQ